MRSVSGAKSWRDPHPFAHTQSGDELSFRTRVLIQPAGGTLNPVRNTAEWIINISRYWYAIRTGGQKSGYWQESVTIRFWQGPRIDKKANHSGAARQKIGGRRGRCQQNGNGQQNEKVNRNEQVNKSITGKKGATHSAWGCVSRKKRESNEWKLRYVLITWPLWVTSSWNLSNAM